MEQYVRIQYKARDINQEVLPEYLYHEKFLVLDIQENTIKVRHLSYVHTFHVDAIHKMYYE